MIYYLAQRGLCGIENYMAGRWREFDFPQIQSVSYEDLFSRRTVPSGTWIFAAVRQLTPAGRRLADIVWRTLTDAGQIALNRPEIIPSRHGLLELMYEAGINDFRSYLPDEIGNDVRFPVFVREVEEHGGNLSGLIASRRELDSFLRWQRLRGYKTRELLVVEFCDTRDERGEYRKYSSQYVQGEAAAQYLHVDRHWLVKYHGSTFRDEWAYEEREFIRQNPRADEVKRIFELAKIDFGRIDYGVLDNKIQVWEINTNPSIGGAPPSCGGPRMPEDMRRLLTPGRRVFFRWFHSMLASIDSPHRPNLIIDLDLPASDVCLWREEVRQVRRLHRRRELLGNAFRWQAVRRARDLAKRTLGVRPS